VCEIDNNLMKPKHGARKMQSQNATDWERPAGPLRSAIHAATMVATLLFVSRANAQQSIPPSPVEPRYTVELIVFAYRTADSGSNEIFVPDKPKLIPDAEEELPADVRQNAFGDAREEVPSDFPEAGSSSGADARNKQITERERIELQLLDPDAYTMDDIYRKLERLDAYQPIMRAAWTQTTPPKEASPAVQLRALGSPPPGLDGSMTLYRGRYLHLVVDLALDADSSNRQAATATDRLIAYGDARVRGDDDSALSDGMRQPVRYRIFEDRIMKTGDVRYFDHPRFGVVARVTRPEEDAASARTAREAAGNGMD
jgi:hypothetical protein